MMEEYDNEMKTYLVYMAQHTSQERFDIMYGLGPY